MKYSNELSSLVINNIFEIERSVLVLDEVEHTIQKKINELFKEKIDGVILLAKDSSLNAHKEKGLYFSDEQWVDSDNETFAFYDFCTSNETSEYSGETVEPRWLSFACGYTASSSINIGFNIQHKKLGLRKDNFKKQLAEQYNKYPYLQELGFRISSNGLYIIKDFILDKSLLAKEYPNELDQSLQPIESSINALLEAHCDFCSIATSFK